MQPSEVEVGKLQIAIVQEKEVQSSPLMYLCVRQRYEKSMSGISPSQIRKALYHHRSDGPQRLLRATSFLSQKTRLRQHSINWCSCRSTKYLQWLQVSISGGRLHARTNKRVKHRVTSTIRLEISSIRSVICPEQTEGDYGDSFPWKSRIQFLEDSRWRRMHFIQSCGKPVSYIRGMPDQLPGAAMVCRNSEWAVAKMT